MAKKKERQFAIKQIVQDERIANQSDLLSRLEGKGYSTTQATLSRDLHEMGIIRIPTPEGYRVLAFRTHYSNREETELETITLVKEGSDWKVVGIFIE